MNREFKPRTKEDYTAEEKCKLFDELLKQARENYDSIVEDGEYDRDDEHRIYESVIDLLGEGVWDVINSKL